MKFIRIFVIRAPCLHFAESNCGSLPKLDVWWCDIT